LDEFSPGFADCLLLQISLENVAQRWANNRFGRFFFVWANFGRFFHLASSGHPGGVSRTRE
jgi:hypothetical protein